MEICPVIPATQKADAGGSLETRSLRPIKAPKQLKTKYIISLWE
jgi:hypothetical protein